MKQSAFIQHLSSYIEHATDAIALVEILPGPRFRYIDANRASAAFSGLPREQLIGMDVCDSTTEPARDAFLKHYNEAIQEKKHVQYEVSYTSETGVYCFETTLAPLYYDEGKCTHLLIFSHDITMRKRMELQLQESEKKHRQLVEAFPDSILIIHEEKIAYINPSGRKLLGAFSVEELIGCSIYEFILPSDRTSAFDFFQRLIGSGAPENGQQRLVRCDGCLIDVQYSGFQFSYENSPAYMLIIQDVSTMVRMRDELDHFFTLSQQLMCICTFEGETLATNPAWETVLGYTADELRQDDMLLSIIHPDDREKLLHIGFDSSEASRVFTYETRIIHKDGKYRMIRWNSSVHKERRTIYASGTDVTDEQAQQDLLQKSEKLSIVGQLAAGIAHEIRNPLTSLKGFLQLFRSKIGSERKYEDYFTIMFNEFSRIEEIVGEFLILAKPQPKSFKLMPIESLLRDIVKLLDIQAIMNKVQIFEDVEPDLPPIRCDENQLKQVFVNVLKNAIEAMPQGGNITVLVRRRDADSLSLRFVDQGPGISELQLDKLGEPFYTTKEGGTGLGLMICHRIIESHHGSIAISSKVGHGTTVEIVLPFAEKLAAS